jgi:hypothetical protein
VFTGGRDPALELVVITVAALQVILGAPERRSLLAGPATRQHRGGGNSGGPVFAGLIAYAVRFGPPGHAGRGDDGPMKRARADPCDDDSSRIRAHIIARADYA